MFHPESFRRVGRAGEWEWYRGAMRAVPGRWLLAKEVEGEDWLLTLNLEQIRADMAIRPPERFRWQSPNPQWIRFPLSLDDRQAMTDQNPETAWIVRYTRNWHIMLDFGQGVSLRAVRLLGDPKDKFFQLQGSLDGKTWHLIHAIPWWVWAGAQLLPYGREYPNPNRWKEQTILLCAPNWIRYLQIRSTPVAGHIALRELQVILQQRH